MGRQRAQEKFRRHPALLLIDCPPRFFFFATRCFGPLFIAASTARSKRCHASGWTSTVSEEDLEDFGMQPLTRVVSDANMFWGDPETMLKRPKAAVRVAQCISEWAEIETMMGIFLAVLLDTESKTALAICASLENRAAQRRMILAAAESKLPLELSLTYLSPP
jgi:hypothetical protein